MVESAAKPEAAAVERRVAPVHPVGLLPAAQSLLYVLVVALFLITFTVQPIRIPSGSMEPTLLIGDFLLLDKEAVAKQAGWLLPSGRVDRGDIVVFHDPVDDPSVHLVKRVIALPGDRLHLRDGVVYLNGQRLQEPYAVHRGSSRDGFRDDFPNLHSMETGINANWWVHLRGLVHDGEITVPAGHYFVMGDNRNDSEDSRYWGFVPRDAIVGKPLLVYVSVREPEPGEPARAATRRSDFIRWKRTFQVVR